MIFNSGPENVMPHVIKAVELYMMAFESARAPGDRDRLRRKIDEVATLGEYLKEPGTGRPIPSRPAREPTSSEKVVLLQSSRLHGTTFLPWRELHSAPNAFALKPSQQIFTYVGRLCPLQEFCCRLASAIPSNDVVTATIPLSVFPRSSVTSLTTGRDQRTCSCHTPPRLAQRRPTSRA